MVELTGQPVVSLTSSAVEPSKDSFSSDSDSDSFTSDRPPVDLFVEEGELSDDQELNITDTVQSISEEQTYRETMRAIGPIWVGPISQTFIPGLQLQMTTPLPD